MDHTDHVINLPSPARIVSEEEYKGVYEIDNLYPGYGNTLGNSIRRILLSSLPGAAVTRVKIDGVSHEFSTIQGVVEDVVMLLLNIKQLRFRLHGEESQTAIIEANGIKEIKGKDIKCPTQLEVVNKDHHIASLSSKSTKFRAELTVEAGLGFVPSENVVREKVEVGMLLLDAIFTPIRRVNYEVENMRVGDRTDYNRLRITIETDGTISPRNAFIQSISIMRAQLERVSAFDDSIIGTPTSDGLAATSSASNFVAAGLSPRTINALIESHITTLDELAQKSADELLQIEGIGAKAISDIKKALENNRLSLRE